MSHRYWGIEETQQEQEIGQKNLPKMYYAFLTSTQQILCIDFK